jgi:hypothetical protein
MSRKWSEWFAIAHWLDHGWNDPTLPWEKGAYRIRVQPGHPKSGGEIVYIGRTGKHTEGENSAICSRVADFITACMGFWSRHAGGNSFFNHAAKGQKERPVHNLSVRDLEVSYVIDGDPICRENEELQKLPRLPAFNKGKPYTCGRANCRRAKKLLASFEKWWRKASK